MAFAICSGKNNVIVFFASKGCWPRRGINPAKNAKRGFAGDGRKYPVLRSGERQGADSASTAE